MRIVRQKDLEVIKSDIEMADLAINSHSENPNMLGMAAYHLGQAIEKSLKAIIRAERPDMYRAVDRDGKPVITISHKIEMLLNKAEICRSGIIASHNFIAENALALSDFNNLRYGKMKITEAELAELSKAAKEIASELEKEFVKANPDVELNKQNTQHEWKSRKESGLTVLEDAQIRKSPIQRKHINSKKSHYRKQSGKGCGKNHGRKKSKQQGRDD